MSTGLQVSFPGAPGGTSAGTSGTALRPTSGSRGGSGSGTPHGTSAPRPTRGPRKGRNLTTEDWVILAMFALALAIATSVWATDGSTSNRGGTQAAPEAAATSAPASGGKVTDPTGTGGLVTATTAHGLAEIVRVFGSLHAGPTLRSAACWDKHAWNPKSDHPLGKGCDLVPGRIGTKAAGADLDHGWALANWLRANAGPLRVNYVIWQGRIWSIAHPQDISGWGRAYNGGGVYNPADVTGGHWDHVHVSFTN